ncbi:hypothetical protein [uncultured Methanospirillum sp.]|uniref:hypothetical protein n=1 Tax=uncultured Methanospirillum sp. TaxID=262503 RepID=UPI0029C6D8CA|nr:hypothetical protein [uncultured Methanospirillum sp.]
MEQQQTDRVLLIVGMLLIIAVIGWIVAGAIIPTKMSDSSKGQKKFTSTGKATLDSPCCKNNNQISAGCQSGGTAGCQGQNQGCQKACSRSGSPSCGRSTQF